jgi:predicted acetyltransferase
MSGTMPGQQGGDKTRVVRYADSEGVTRGIAVYRISDEGEDFTKHELELSYLLSETPDAYAALWRFALEHDLVSVVKAHLRSTDEPLRWMIADQRAAKVETREHHWLRILDVPATLSARRYASAGSFTLQVADPLGFAEGTWSVSVDADGVAEVTPSDGRADAVLGVDALSSLLLGGVRAVTLREAGLIDAEPSVAIALDAVFTSAQTPHLGVWY